MPQMRRQVKRLLSRVVIPIMLLAVFLLSFSGLNTFSIFMSEYSSGAAPQYQNREGAEVIVYGYVFNATKVGYTPVSDIKVRLYATDEFIEEIVYTNFNGMYTSTKSFKPAQLITVMINGERYVRFIDYSATSPFRLENIII